MSKHKLPTSKEVYGLSPSDFKELKKIYAKLNERPINYVVGNVEFNAKLKIENHLLEHLKIKSILTKRDKYILDVLSKHFTVIEACRDLKMTKEAVYNKLFHMRRKYTKARKYTNQILQYRRKNALLDKLLRPKIPKVENNNA